MDLPVVIPLTLLALGVSALGTLLRPRLDTVLATLLLAAVWSRVNAPVEGEILHSFTADRGLTVADLASVAGVLVAGLGLVRLLARWARGTSSRSPGRPRPVAPHQGP